VTTFPGRRSGGRLLAWQSSACTRLPLGSARIESVSRVIHVPYTLEQDEDGVWCASAQLRPGVGAVGDGATADEAIADLRDVLTALIEEVGVPQELTLDVA
jgi:predicted RNase H-like HicB family nuclease